ncbi:hypothetical protein DyAD56_22845 [Dyella sp. AD56]|nr:hypothetical protein DyAD56_22845 [Dyella sp. AD56]
MRSVISIITKESSIRCGVRVLDLLRVCLCVECGETSPSEVLLSPFLTNRATTVVAHESHPFVGTNSKCLPSIELLLTHQFSKKESDCSQLFVWLVVRLCAQRNKHSITITSRSTSREATRHGEHARKGDVHLHAREIHLRKRERLKSQASVRCIPITDRYFEALRAFLDVLVGPFKQLNMRRLQDLWRECHGPRSARAAPHGSHARPGGYW